MSAISISKRFSNGLKRYNITLDNLQDDWRYCGGEYGRHFNYYTMCCKDKDLPEHEERCLCGHRIKENCYITNGTHILTLGNCCVKRFIPNKTRTCERCGNAHRNRKDNICLNCRKSFYRTDYPNGFILKFN